jgi:hypothetical protein
VESASVERRFMCITWKCETVVVSVLRSVARR